MNPSEFESLVSGEIRRIESYSRIAWLGRKSTTVTNLNGAYLETSQPTSNRDPDQSKSPPPLTLKSVFPGPSMEEVEEGPEQLFLRI